MEILFFTKKDKFLENRFGHKNEIEKERERNRFPRTLVLLDSRKGRRYDDDDDDTDRQCDQICRNFATLLKFKRLAIYLRIYSEFGTIWSLLWQKNVFGHASFALL